MSKSGVQGNFYLGTVASVPEDGNFEIVADIPGVIRGVKAFPLRGDCDEPKPGDAIILLGLDPEYNSYYLYWKLKENDFTGFRAYGKEISIEEEKLVIRSYSGENSEDGEHEPGEEVARIQMDDKGNLVASNKAGAEIKITDNGDIKTSSPNEKSTITLKNDGNIEIETLGGEISFKGGGTIDFGVLLNDSKLPTGFLNIPAFPPPGTPVAASVTSKVTFIGG